VEALCATISLPSHFVPVKVGPQLTQRNFIGGPRGAHNPTRELLKEAETVFGNEKHIAQIISIGCGVPRALSLEMMTQEVGLGRLPKEVAADCQMVAQDLDMRLFNVDAYHRFEVEKGMADLEISNWAVLGEIENLTVDYIQTSIVTRHLDLSLQGLQSKVGTVTLGQLSK